MTGAGGGGVGLVGLHAAAAKVGAWCWAERRCFELLGAWVREAEDPMVKAMVSVHSRHHAWRAQRWEEILPRAYAKPAGDLIVASADAEAFEFLDQLQPIGNRLAGHYHVLYPALLEAYEASPVLMSPLSDGPALRATRIILGDGRQDLEEAKSVSGQWPGGISDPDHLTHLRHLVAKTQVSGGNSGDVTTVFQHWGS